MDCQSDAEAMSAEKIKAIVKDVMQRAAFLVKAANDLPRRGDDFELCNSFSAFTAFMEQQETRIRLMLDSLMRNAGCPTRLPKLNSDVEEYLGRIVMVDDRVVERVGIVMDELDRGGREDVEVPKTVIGAESVKKRKAEAEAKFQEQIQTCDPGLVLAERLRRAHEEATGVVESCPKPQKEYGFESFIDNSYNAFIPKLVTKHHALSRMETTGMIIIDEDVGSDGSKRYLSVDDSAALHPYLYEIQNFVVPDVQLKSKAPSEFMDISKTPLTMVENVEDLRRIKRSVKQLRRVCCRFRASSLPKLSGIHLSYSNIDKD
ncbi:hypothetical protein KIN20_000715 [Parelaphostrongylus tenuis]|uniref:Exosome-associated factor Rrp6 N-terminal domain-containing protein n=1 Tax=Parelaphostrongylus tenuis TaxID=148309 RepID=A0AAD5QFS0_PARTN|nr:hypothetical protein KIN20_000715 [Parelaphostrongylus tenuis]